MPMEKFQDKPDVRRSLAVRMNELENREFDEKSREGPSNVALSTRAVPPSRPNRIDAVTGESSPETLSEVGSPLYSADDRQGMPVASGTSCRPDDTDAGKRSSGLPAK
jgi:hypothetical protein